MDHVFILCFQPEVQISTSRLTTLVVIAENEHLVNLVSVEERQQLHSGSKNKIIFLYICYSSEDLP